VELESSKALHGKANYIRSVILTTYHVKKEGRGRRCDGGWVKATGKSIDHTETTKSVAARVDLVTRVLAHISMVLRSASGCG
jgi:hypothetical protein